MKTILYRCQKCYKQYDIPYSISKGALLSLMEMIECPHCGHAKVKVDGWKCSTCKSGCDKKTDNQCARCYMLDYMRIYRKKKSLSFKHCDKI